MYGCSNRPLEWPLKTPVLVPYGVPTPIMLDVPIYIEHSITTVIVIPDPDEDDVGSSATFSRAPISYLFSMNGFPEGNQQQAEKV